jgi:hypothetical protein
MSGGWRVPGFAELAELGAGGQGRAVLVREERSGRVAVLKYVAYASDQTVLARFRQESALLKRVHSVHVARWYGHFEDVADAAILMEAVPGVSLRTVLAEHQRLTGEASLAVLKGSLLGLAAGHNADVVHRDYKPANVVVTADGQSKLIDFGVAVLAGSEAGGSGTPAYMAPEQWQTHTATRATDVYAATCVFFECVTGRQPYAAASQPLLRWAHTNAPIPVDAVDEALRPLIARGLAKAPRDRPAGAAEFVAELEATASAAYGTDWEERGIAALAASAATLAMMFPLAALTAGSGGSIAVTTTSRTLLGKITTAKAAATATAVAVGGAAVIAVVAAPAKKAVVARPTAAAFQSFSYRTMTLRLPVGWSASAVPVPAGAIDDEMGISPGNGCRVAGYWDTGCTHVRVLGPKSLFDALPMGGSPYNTSGGGYFPAGGIMQCPGSQLWMYQTTTPPAQTVLVGGRTARYWQFTVPCGPQMPNGTTPKATSSFTQREWYLPQTKTLIITNGPIPRWDTILANAQWARTQ